MTLWYVTYPVNLGRYSGGRLRLGESKSGRGDSQRIGQAPHRGEPGIVVSASLEVGDRALIDTRLRGQLFLGEPLALSGLPNRQFLHTGMEYTRMGKSCQQESGLQGNKYSQRE